MADLTLRMGAQAQNVGVARRVLETVLGGVGVSPETIADVKTTVTEACANAVAHAYSGGSDGVVEVEARVTARHLAIAVRDYGNGFPSGFDRRTAGTGLGLPIVRALADEVEIRAAPGRGTEVEIGFELDPGGV